MAWKLEEWVQHGVVQHGLGKWVRSEVPLICWGQAPAATVGTINCRQQWTLQEVIHKFPHSANDLFLFGFNPLIICLFSVLSANANKKQVGGLKTMQCKALNV